MTELSTRQKEGYNVAVDFLFVIALLLLAIHFIWFCYEAFAPIRLLGRTIYPFLFKIHRRYWLLEKPPTSLLLIAALLLLHGVGSRGRVDPRLTYKAVGYQTLAGLMLLLLPGVLLGQKVSFGAGPVNTVYILLCTGGFLALVRAEQQLSRLISRPRVDLFNTENEEFPQHQGYLDNPYSVHYRTQYRYKGKWHEGDINIINPFRSVQVIGLPGSGKSYAILIPAIWQSIYKGYTAFLYDFKFPDLTLEAYNAYLKTIAENPWAWTNDLPAEQARARIRAGNPLIPKFYVINFDDVERTHRCNPLTPSLMRETMDAYESAQTIMLNLNRTWAQKQGEFFPESAINFMTAIIWYLRTVALHYQQEWQQHQTTPRPADPHQREQWHQTDHRLSRLSRVCTFPHALEFINQPYEQMFPLMAVYPQVETYIRSFMEALKNKAMEQLEGQIASVRIPITRMASPTLYWVMTGDDFTLDLNNPADPKIICAGNNPERISIMGTALSLYTSRIMKLANKKDRLKSALFWDELPTMFIKGIDVLIATARSNRVATWLGIQDYEQLNRDYGDKEAKVIMNIVGNLFSGSVVNETADKLARRFGKTNQEKESITYTKSDTTINVSTQQADMIPASKIATMKQGEFAGQSVDNFGEEINLKTFKSYIHVDTGHFLAVHFYFGQVLDKIAAR